MGPLVDCDRLNSGRSISEEMAIHMLRFEPIVAARRKADSRDAGESTGRFPYAHTGVRFLLLQAKDQARGSRVGLKRIFQVYVMQKQTGYGAVWSGKEVDGGRVELTGDRARPASDNRPPPNIE